MPKYVAFLRAINVGGHTVKMDHLRLIFEAMGLKNVETFIASGNVIFDSTAKNSKALESKIEEFLQERLGYQVATFIRSTSEVENIARYNPFRNAELNGKGNVLYIAFVEDKPGEEARQKLLSFTTEVEELHVYEREVYWLLRRKRGESALSGGMIEKTLGLKATLRNSNTVKRIASKYADPLNHTN